MQESQFDNTHSEKLEEQFNRGIFCKNRVFVGSDHCATLKKLQQICDHFVIVTDGS